MTDESANHIAQRHLLARFWQSASGFWRGPQAWRSWLLCALLLGTLAAQLATQYWLNYWNRDFFDALEQRNAVALGQTALLFIPLAALSIALAIISVWGRMTTQRNWRKYLTTHVVDAWLRNGNFRLLNTLNGSDTPRNPEYRIAEDVRVATDAPIDLVLALISSVLTAIIFFEVLARVGGTLTIKLSGSTFTIPGYLVIGVIAYSGVMTAAMLWIGRRFIGVVQDQVQAEATFRAAANLLRESGDGIVVAQSESEERRALWAGFRNVIEQWRRLCWQHMRTTFVTHGNTLLAPVIALFLCAPKYLLGVMTLGEVTQAAAAFVLVQGAFNWVVDNFQRTADWRASANRVAALLLALDDLARPAAAREAAPEAAPEAARAAGDAVRGAV
jgi:ABC-type uncharacterized transport system fused permease/ATPase subunit